MKTAILICLVVLGANIFLSGAEPLATRQHKERKSSTHLAASAGYAPVLSDLRSIAMDTAIALVPVALNARGFIQKLQGSVNKDTRKLSNVNELTTEGAAVITNAARALKNIPERLISAGIRAFSIAASSKSKNRGLMSIITAPFRIIKNIIGCIFCQIFGIEIFGNGCSTPPPKGTTTTTSTATTTEDSTTEDSTTEDSTTEDSTTEDSTTEDSTTEDSTTEDSTTEDSTTETTTKAMETAEATNQQTAEAITEPPAEAMTEPPAETTVERTNMPPKSGSFNFGK